MPNLSASVNGTSVNVSGGGNLSPAEARALATRLTSAATAAEAAAAKPTPVPGTFTVWAPVSRKAGNNVLHGVTEIVIKSNGRVSCFSRTGAVLKYPNGETHDSFSKSVRATKGRYRGQMRHMKIEYVPTA